MEEAIAERFSSLRRQRDGAHFHTGCHLSLDALGLKRHQAGRLGLSSFGRRSGSEGLFSLVRFSTLLPSVFLWKGGGGNSWSGVGVRPVLFLVALLGFGCGARFSCGLLLFGSHCDFSEYSFWFLPVYLGESIFFFYIGVGGFHNADLKSLEVLDRFFFGGGLY